MSVGYIRGINYVVIVVVVFVVVLSSDIGIVTVVLVFVMFFLLPLTCSSLVTIQGALILVALNYLC